MRILRQFLSPRLGFLLYSSSVKPLIEFCATLFVGRPLSVTDTKRFTKLQSRFHRMVCPQNCNCPYFPDVDKRRLILSKNFLRKMIDSSHYTYRTKLSNIYFTFLRAVQCTCYQETATDVIVNSLLTFLFVVIRARVQNIGIIAIC